MINASKKEVKFDIYCQKCEYFGVVETQDPCNECLEFGMRYGSEKPEKFKEKESKK